MTTTFEASSVSNCYTIFPVRRHPADRVIAEGCDDARRLVERLAGRGWKIPRKHCEGPYGNFCSFSFPDGETEKIRITTEMLEALWVYDDMVEDVPQSEAHVTHNVISDTLSGTVEKETERSTTTSGRTLERKDLMVKMFKDFAPRMLAIDPQGATRAIEGVQSYLREYDTKDNSAIEDVNEYIKFRGFNAGYGIMESFLQWILDLNLDWRATPLSRDYYQAAAEVFGLTNDYYSWEVERHEPGDRKWNAVPVLMRLRHLREPEALAALRAIVHTTELRAQQLGARLRHDSPDWAVYVEGVEVMLGANAFWSASCPRYNPELYS